MTALIKSTAIAVLLTGTACIASFATDLTGRAASPAPVLPVQALALPPDAAGMVAAARISLPSAISLDLETRDGRRTYASAFVYSADGLLLTAAHVADPDARITAILPDGRRVVAALVARDVLSDVALLRVTDAGPLVAARFAATGVEPGERIAALGSPLGYSRSLTAGTVSAAARAYGSQVPYDFIQHDAALNPGSSGGALVNTAGEVVGMNVAIADGARHAIGISLAVPAPLVEAIAQRLLREGAIVRPVAGLRLRDAREVADAPEGAAVEEVEAGSTAEKAGIRPGMIVVRAGAIRIRAPRDLARALEPLKPGDRLEIETAGTSTAATYTLTLAAPPPQPPAGLAAQTILRRPLAMQIRLVPSTARIAQVAPGSPAARAGLKAGDVLLALGDRRLEAATAEDELKSASGARIGLLVQRQGVSRYVVMGEEGRLDLLAPFGSNAEAMDSAKL